jgi:hypothetical protein
MSGVRSSRRGLQCLSDGVSASRRIQLRVLAAGVLRVSRRSCHRLRRIGVTTAGDASTLGAAVLFASNCAGLRTITLHWLQALKGVSYRAPLLRSTVTRW